MLSHTPHFAITVIHKVPALRARIYANIVRSVLKRACEMIKCKKPPAVAIIFISDQQMRQLNKIYRGKNKSTNVLSFDTGDIFISMPFAKREAKKFNWTLKYEISRLALHGFLHLVGYDHENEKEAKGMEEIEEKILKNYSNYSN